MSDLIKLTGLWINEKNGRKYMSGTLRDSDIEALTGLGDMKILIFKNDDKEDNQPDYRMLAAPKEDNRQPVENPPSGGGNNKFEDNIPFSPA